MAVPSEVLIESYQRLGNVWKVADEVGLCGQSVHERLQKLGVVVPTNVFTEDERDRLRHEYVIYRDAGKLQHLADDMGRTKQFICRQAKLLGLTDKNAEKRYLSVWKYITDDAAEVIWDDFKSSSKGVTAYCLAKGYDDLGFARAMREKFADEYESVIELKVPKTSKYRRGRQFEYTIRDNLKKHGYFCMRSPASKSPVDILAVAPGLVLMVQAKLHGAIGVKEWNTLYDLAESCGSIPLLARRPASGRGAEYFRMTDRKDGSKRPQPMVPFDPRVLVEELT